MVFGTSSGSGKSLIVAAICRVLLRRGEFPIPFKGQNMSNNAWVDKDGGEMAYSQAFQAWAAGVLPECSMNPVLLKPRGDHTSEVIHLGKTVGIANAETYYEDWFLPGWRSIQRGINQLVRKYNNSRIILEGAGSPVEVNLKRRDLTNLRLAQYLKAQCILVSDIERGGVFAQIIGTLDLLSPSERKLIKGIIINKFRGRIELFEDGRRWLEAKTGLPVIGVLPWLNELFPAEDSLDLINRSNNNWDYDIEVVVIRLKSISNFSDFDPLEAEPTIKLKWVEPGKSIGNPDVVVIPGSKQTISDLMELKNSSSFEEINNYVEGGGNIFGICGGLQMLGNRLSDPANVENSNFRFKKESLSGFGFLPINTLFDEVKKLERRETLSNWPVKTTVSGFEMHRGKSSFINIPREIEFMFEDPSLGLVLENKGGGVISGTYMHGIFDNGTWRRTWINTIRMRKGLADLNIDLPHYSKQREALIDFLADAFERHIHLGKAIS